MIKNVGAKKQDALNKIADECTKGAEAMKNKKPMLAETEGLIDDAVALGTKVVSENGELVGDALSLADGLAKKLQEMGWWNTAFNTAFVKKVKEAVTASPEDKAEMV